MCREDDAAILSVLADDFGEVVEQTVTKEYTRHIPFHVKRREKGSMPLVGSTRSKSTTTTE